MLVYYTGNRVSTYNMMGGACISKKDQYILQEKQKYIQLCFKYLSSHISDQE